MRSSLDSDIKQGGKAGREGHEESQTCPPHKADLGSNLTPARGQRF